MLGGEREDRCPQGGHGGFSLLPVSRAGVQPPNLAQMAEELKTQSAQHEVYAFFKHEEQPESALNAVTVARVCGIEEKPFVMPEKKGRRAQGDDSSSQ